MRKCAFLGARQSAERLTVGLRREAGRGAAGHSAAVVELLRALPRQVEGSLRRVRESSLAVMLHLLDGLEGGVASLLLEAQLAIDLEVIVVGGALESGASLSRDGAGVAHLARETA